MKRLVACLVTKANRRSPLMWQPFVAPFHQRKGVGVGIEAACRQPVLVSAGTRLISLFLEKIATDQERETVGQGIPRNIQVSLEIVEPAYPKERFLMDEEAPWIANGFQRMGEWRNR